MKDKLLTTLFGIAAALLIISFSIGIPIWFRPFYYWQIDVLEIEEYSGEDRETIREAYDEVLDYLTIDGKENQEDKHTRIKNEWADSLIVDDSAFGNDNITIDVADGQENVVGIWNFGE